MSVIRELKTETIKEFVVPSVLASYYEADIPTTKKGLIAQVNKETETAGVKELASLMKAMELREVCDYLEVEYKEGASMNNRMMLSKRFVETFDDVSVEEWFSVCEDRAILASICTIMGFVVTKKSSIDDLRTAGISQIRKYGDSVVLHRLPVSALQQVCEDMGLDGAYHTQSKRILIHAITTKQDIAGHEAKKTTRSKKKPIHKATIKAELQQHYMAKTLESWCKENGLKSSGNKKTLIDRILAFNAGDTENTMATNTIKSTTKKSTKKATKKVVEEEEEEEEVKKVTKKAKKPTKKAKKPEISEEEEEDVEEEVQEQSEEVKEQSEEEEDTEEKEDAAIAAERDLRVTEEAEDEEIEVSMSLSASENDYPTNIEGLSFALKGNFTHTKKELQNIITANGGIVSKSVTKKTTVISTDEAFNAKLTKKGITVHPEEFLSHFF